MSEVQLHQWIGQESVSLKAERNSRGYNLEIGVKAETVERAMEMLRQARQEVEREFPAA